MKQTLPAILAIVLFAAATIFAFDAYWGMASSRESLTERIDQLSEAQKLYSKHAAIFNMAARGSAKVELKSLVQDSSAHNGIRLIYLNESEKDTGDKVRERNVVARAINVPHGSLVNFLADLEARGGGAKLKEIRVKPSTEQPDLYQEAEAVLSLRWISDKTDRQDKKGVPQ